MKIVLVTMAANSTSHHFKHFSFLGESSEPDIWLVPAALIYSKGWREKIIGLCNARRKIKKVIVKGLFHTVCSSACLFHSNLCNSFLAMWNVVLQNFVVLFVFVSCGCFFVVLLVSLFFLQLLEVKYFDDLIYVMCNWFVLHISTTKQLKMIWIKQKWHQD